MNGSENIRKISINIGWLFIDKVLRIGLNFLLTVWIARYLGVESFGIWNYAIAFTALFSILSTLGLESIIIKNLVSYPDRTHQILGSALFLKIAGGILAVIFSVITILLVRPDEVTLTFLVGITACGFIFQAFDTIDLYFQSKLQSRFAVYARYAAFILIAALKYFLIISGFSVLAFAWANLIELALSAIFLVIVISFQQPAVHTWRINIVLTRKIFQESLPLMFAGLVILIYMRIDQIMLGNLIGDSAVGIYSAAIRLSEVWYFIPLIITNSTFPAILEAKKINEHVYLAKLQKLYNIMAWLGVGAAITMTFLANYIIEILYGVQYAEAGTILSIHIWTCVFVFLGFACNNWFVTENLQRYSFYRTAAGAVCNVGLNLILIPEYGGTGAAVATLISQFIASYFSNLFNKKTFIVFKMQTTSLLNVLLLRNLFKFASKT